MWHYVSCIAVWFLFSGFSIGSLCLGYNITQDIMTDYAKSKQVFSTNFNWYDNNNKEFFRITKDGELIFNKDVKMDSQGKSFVEFVNKQTIYNSSK